MDSVLNLKGKDLHEQLKVLASWSIEDIQELYNDMDSKEKMKFKLKFLNVILPYVLTRSVSVNMKSEMDDFAARVSTAIEQTSSK